MGSKGPEGASRKRKLARVVLDWLYDQAVEAMIGAALTVVLIAVGIGYEVDDHRIDEAAVVASRQAGSAEVGDGYASFVTAKRELEDRVQATVPAMVQDDLRGWSLGIAGGLLAICVTIALLRAPSRAHIFKAMGWGILQPGLIAAFVAIVLEWRALRGVRATLSGERKLDVLLAEARHAAGDAGSALWPALVGGLLAIVFGIALHRKWRASVERVELSPRHVTSHFLVVLGAVPWVHYAVAIVLDAFTVGNSTGASIAPFVRDPFDYFACAALFSLGTSFWVLARHEIRHIEATEKP